MKLCVDFKRQNQFAKLSGDYNPLHINKNYAKKSMFGSIVVHGVHQLIYAVDFLCAKIKTKITIEKIEAKFENVLACDCEFEIELINTDADWTLIKIFNFKEGYLLTEVKIKYTTANFMFEKYEPKIYTQNAKKCLYFDNDGKCEDLNYDDKLFESMFEHAGQYTNPVNIGALLASTRIVGMKCPGINSIFASLSLSFGDINSLSNKICYCTKKHPHLNLVNIQIESPEINGKLKAFIRPEEPRAKKICELKSYVKKNDFINQRALIIGATRGIGLQCLKLLTLGGAQTLFTYRNDESEPKAINHEFITNGLETNYVKFDVINITENTIRDLREFAPTHLYYFATPKLTNPTGVLSLEHFIKLAEFYIFALDKLILNLKSLKGVFTPSTTAIDELPKDMAEYAFVKYASELYRNFIVKNNPSLKFYMPRFPRVKTSQTLSIIEVSSQQSEDVLKEELKKFLNM